MDLSDRAFYREALRTGGLGVGEFVVSRVRRTGAIGFGYPVLGDRGEVVAVAFASLASERLQHELDELDLPAGAQVAVLDRRGVTLAARPDGGRRWMGHPFDERLVSAARAGGPVALDGTDGVRRLYDLRGVTAPDGTVAMHVLAGIPLGAVVDPVNRVFTRALAGSLLASALALAVAVLVAEFTLVRRLRRLAAASQRIAAGDWSARTGLPARGDELGELAASFDEMASALEELDREKRLRDEQLRQAQKMEAVGQLAGGVAHDFNNLLTVILSAASSLRERLPQEHEGQEDAREIHDAGERAAALTRQLLAFSRRQHLAPSLVDLGETAAGMERMLRRVLGEDVALSVEIRGPALVYADPGQLEIALLNLAAERSRRHAPRRAARRRGGAARRRGPRPPGRAPTCRPGRSRCSPSATRARGWTPRRAPGSSSRSSRRRGRGAAPASASRSCSGSSRSAAASSGSTRRPGKGSEFRLFLPLREGQRTAAAEPEPRAPPRGTETVLVVEDDPHLRGVVRRALTQHGYAVRAVGSAADARALALEAGAPPDLVLTDVILPDGNGLDLARDLVRGAGPTPASSS